MVVTRPQPLYHQMLTIEAGTSDYRPPYFDVGASPLLFRQPPPGGFFFWRTTVPAHTEIEQKLADFLHALDDNLEEATAAETFAPHTCTSYAGGY